MILSLAILHVRHQYEVIRLWEQPSETLLQTPGLFPFAILAQAEKPENLLGQIDDNIVSKILCIPLDRPIEKRQPPRLHPWPAMWKESPVTA